MKILIHSILCVLISSSSVGAWGWGSTTTSSSDIINSKGRTENTPKYIRGLQESAPPKTESPPKCLDDIVLMRQIGTRNFPMDAVEIVSRDTSTVPHTVTVSLNQQWNDATPIDSIFSYYHETTFSRHCYENTRVDQGVFDTITATCNFLTPMAYLEVCVVDDIQHGVLTVEDDADVPKCCSPDFPPETPVVCYSLQISCVPTCEEAITNEPAPTMKPTASPTKSPTIAPTASPTKSPTIAPTAFPTKSPTNLPTKEPSDDCLESSQAIIKEVVGNDSIYTVNGEFKIPPVTVTAQNDDQVTVKVKQVFNPDGIPMMAVDYRDPETYESQCKMEAPKVNYDFELEITSQCVLGYTEFTLYMYVGSDDDFNVEECEACSLPNENDYVAYLLVVPCDPVCKPATVTTANPTKSPTAAPTKSPTNLPTNDLTASPTKSPTKFPVTIAPTKALCEEKMVSDVCIAIDNSGSICTNPGLSQKLCDTCREDQCSAGGGLSNGLCCGNYESITNFASTYVDNLPSDSTFSVVKYGSAASVISPFGSSPSDAKKAITISQYTGGYTNTEDAILKCVDELKESQNPVIVLITDGTPTACNNKNNNGVSLTGRGGCTANTCDKCNGKSFAGSAERAATLASNAGVTLIPVVISSVATDIDQLEDLARCPANSDDFCSVDDYKSLNVESLDELDTILDALVTTTECAGNDIIEIKLPTDVPTRGWEEVIEPPGTDCDCAAGDDHAGSFKCGNDLYLCPGVDQICSTQGSQNTVYYYLDEEQCDRMKAVDLGSKCIAVPEQDLDRPKGLSNRVCYGGNINGRFGTKVDSGSCDECQGLIRVPLPPTPPTPEEPEHHQPTEEGHQAVDPGSFCHALGVKDECNLNGQPGSCQINPGPNNEPSCGWGVPAGYYPDLDNCNAYCKCTGTTAPSRYEIVNTGLEWDNFQQEESNYYLPGVYGKDGAWGTNGGGAGRPSDMSLEGRNRPPQCGPKQDCPTGSYKPQPWNHCQQFFTCNNGKSGPVQSCGSGLLFRADLGICDWPANVKCTI